MFKTGYYRHKAFKDVYIEVLPGRYIGPKYSKLKINWWNLGFTGNPWRIFSRSDKITVYKEDYKSWLKLSENDIINLSMDKNRWI